MNLRKWTASTMTALLIAAAPAYAGDDHDKMHDGHHSAEARYDFNIAPGEVMLFNDPVSFTGEVIAASPSHRTLRAANGMTIMVPNQALVWNGDTQMFSQDTDIGEEVVLHLRSEEPYRIMDLNSPYTPMFAIGSYDGVFYFSDDFIADLDLDELDDNIYAEYDRDGDDRFYDIDLASVEDYDEDDFDTADLDDDDDMIDNDGDIYDENDPDEVYED